MEIERFLNELRRRNSRGLIVLSGNPRVAAKTLALTSINNILYVRGNGDFSGEVASIFKEYLRGKSITFLESPSEVFRRLGEEYNYVILDVYEVLRPNVVAASTEMIKAGGALVLLTKEWSSWNPTPLAKELSEGVFTKYIKERISKAYPLIHYDCEEKRVLQIRYPKTTILLPKEERIDFRKFRAHKQLIRLCATEEQATFLDKFVELMKGKGRVLLAKGDRGRGKSSALGLALAQAILARYIGNATVTAPSLESVQSLMRMLKKALTALNIKYRVIERKGLIKAVYGPWFKVEFKDPASVEGYALIVVDEASALGIARLKRIVWKSRKVVAATTIHGYEGSGHVLEQIVLKNIPNPVIVNFKKPIRYGLNDPLEQWLYETFLLNIEPYPVSENKVEYSKINKEELIRNQEILRRIYGLLVIAHYRNMPDDLVTLLDAKHHKIRALVNSKGEIIAVAQLALEKGQNVKDLSKAKGLLIIDKFAKYGVDEALSTKGVRIVRIAVHPSLQGKGYGSFLLRRIEEEFRDNDWIASIFSRNDVLHFWVRNDYSVFYISPRYNKVTGEKNIAVLKPSNGNFERIFKDIVFLFKRKLIFTSNSIYRVMQAEVLLEEISSVSKYVFPNIFSIDSRDMEKLGKYVEGKIPYHEHIFEIAFLLIAKGIMEDKFSKLDTQEKLALIMRFLQGKPLNTLSEVLLTPQSKVEELTRESLKKLIHL